MKTFTDVIRRLGFLAIILFVALKAQANPIEMPERSVTSQIVFLISISILLESGCVAFLLRRFRKPRLFILWIIGMHLLTYPAFLGFLKLFENTRPIYGVVAGEGLVVLVEGILVYLICRFGTAIDGIPQASFVRCLVASLVGNVCSMIAFPCLVAVSHIAFPYHYGESE